MAIILTNTAKYDPFNFQELAAPYILVDKAAGEVMDTIDELGSKADLMKKYADEDPDSPYAKAYNNFSADLEQAASDMAKYGMSAAVRNNVRGLKRRYSSDISPMEEAAVLFKEQRKERLSHPERIYNKTLTFKNAYNNTIDNTYLTESDVTKETILNYSSGFNTSYSKWIEQGATPEQAIIQARQENINTLFPMLEKLNQAGYDTNDDRIQKAIQTGMSSIEADITKGELMTRKERNAEERAKKSLLLQESTNTWNKEVKTAELQAKGITHKDGKFIIDPNNKGKNTQEQITYLKNNIAWDSNRGGYLSEDLTTTAKVDKGTPVAIKPSGEGIYKITVGNSDIATFTKDGTVTLEEGTKNKYKEETITQLVYSLLSQLDKNENTFKTIDIIVGPEAFIINPRNRGKDLKDGDIDISNLGDII